MTVAEDKQTIREEILSKRNPLWIQEIDEWSNGIHKNLSVLDPFVKSRIVLFYASYKNEVKTDEMILDALLTKKVLLPRMSGGEIIPTLIMDMDNLIFGHSGIREPLDAPSIKASTIDAVIVPGIGFDLKGNRLGTGQGCYDKFLRKTHAVKIGIGFECQLSSHIPKEEHDIAMDFIVTEKGIIDCKKL